MKAILATVILSFLMSSMAFAQLGVVGNELRLVTTTGATKEGKSLILKLLNSKGKVIQTIISKPTAKAILNTYLPSKLSQSLKSGASKAAASGAFVRRVMGQKLLRFPQESAGFYAALGAVMTYELAFNYANNPVAYEQLHKSQLDPVGQLGFYFFMVGNGVAAEPLMNLIQQGKLNRKFAPFIPFFGMGVGSVASNIVHELGHSPNLWACARGLLSGKGMQAKPCDQAAQTWHDRGGVAGIAHEWAPTLVALSGSIVLSGIAKSGIGVVGKGTMAVAALARNGTIEVTAKVFGKAGLRAMMTTGMALALVTTYAPGGIFIKGLWKVATFVGELTLFTWIDEVTRRPIIFHYQNIVNGGWIRKTHDQIQSVTESMNKSKWTSIVTQGHVDDIRAFSKVMSQWRQHNLANVLEAQANWQQALSKISNTYTASEIFYNEFLEYLWEKHYGKFAASYADGTDISITDKIFPLYGIKPSDLPEKAESLYLSNFNTIELGQLRTVEMILEKLENGQLFKGKNLGQMSEGDSKKFQAIVKNLKTLEPIPVGKALVTMNNEIAAGGNARAMAYCQNACAMGSALQMRLILIRNALGNPSPIFHRGLGFAKYYDLSGEHSEMLKVVTFKKKFGGITDSINVDTPRFVDSMIASMFMGPDPRKNESSLGVEKGYIATFNPPQITKQDASFNITDYMLNSRGHGTIVNVYDAEVSAKDSSNKFHRSAYSYITRGGIRSDLLNEDKDAMKKWWNARIEPQYVRAWVNFENHYQKNIAKLMQAMNAPQANSNRYGFLWTRKTNVPNGVLASFNFENNLYLEILTNMSRQLAVNQYPQMRYTVTTKRVTAPFWRRGSLPKYPWDVLGIIGQQTAKTELQKIFKPSPQLAAATAWLTELDSSLRKLNEYASKIKAAYNVKKKSPKEVLTISYVENEDIQNTVNEANKALKKSYGFLGLAKSHATPLKLAQGQKILARLAIQGLDKNIMELTQYLLIANSVSYHQRHGTGKIEWQSKRCKNMTAPVNMKAMGASYVQRVAGCE